MYITDRSMDLFSPLIHEFTYQAMVHDLLPIKEGDKVTYRVKASEGAEDKQDKDVELSEKDRLWTANRHKHMKDTIDRLMGDFQKFMDENPHFTKQDAGGSNSLNAIKDMLAGLPQFQEMKEAYSLHLSMAQESMNIFQRNKLADLASVEQVSSTQKLREDLIVDTDNMQSLATGLDEDYKKPKNMADQVVRMLDEESIVPADRLRLLTMYLLYRDGLLPADTAKLIQHANLHPQDNDMIANLSQLGASTTRTLKDARPKPAPLFAPPQAPPPGTRDDYSLSRFTPAISTLLIQHSTETLSQETFPYTKPELEPTDTLTPTRPQLTTLRSAKPTWATTRTMTTKPKQRILIFMAGGATYSESRATYEASAANDKDVYLITSHMITPALFIRQVRDLSQDPRRLGIPALAPPRKAPAHLWEAEPEPEPPRVQPQVQQPRQPQQMQPPTAQMANLNVQNGMAAGRPQSQSQQQSKPQHTTPHSTWQPPEEKEKEKKKGKLKKLLGSSK